jgi:hypothetical protein
MRAARIFRVEGAGEHVLARKIVQQRAGNRGLAHAALVSAYENECRLHHYPLDFIGPLNHPEGVICASLIMATPESTCGT